MLKAGKSGCQLRVRVSPKASGNTLIGMKRDAAGHTYLKVSVTAVPEKGRANAALIKLLAQKLGLPKTSISLIAGETSRLKTLHIKGKPEELLNILDAKLRALGLMA